MATTKPKQAHTRFLSMRLTPKQHEAFLKNSDELTKSFRAHLDSLAEQEQEGAK